MTIYASTKTHNNDPEPWLMRRGAEDVRAASPDFDHPAWFDRENSADWSPRAEYDTPRAHDGNPILIAARENWDNGSDPWGQALMWLDALDGWDTYESVAEAEDMGAGHEVATLLGLAANDGTWTLPAPTPEHLAHAERVFDRMADVARTLGLDY